MKARSSVFQVVLAAVVGGALLVAACAPAAPAPTPRPAVTTPKPTVATTVPTPTPKPVVVAPTPTPRPTPTPVVAPPVEKPRYGGVLRLAVNLDPPTFDPHEQPVTGVTFSSLGFYNGLVWFDPKSHLEPKVIPDLAERWEMSPDGTVYTFHLNKGVKWHDGAPVTARDVVFSLNKIDKPPKGIIRGRVAAGLVAVKEVEAPDDYTVKITLKYPSGGFLENLANSQAMMVPKDHLEKGGYWEGKNILAKKPIGSGPFTFKEAIHGVSVEGVKNPNYFKKGLPYLDGYIVYIIPDNAALLAALRTERIHFMPSTQLARPSQEKILKDAMGDRIVTWHNFRDSSFDNFGLNLKKKPFTDVRVRQAIRMALKNEEFYQIVYEGLGKPGGPITQSYWALPKEELQKYPGFEPNYEARLARARELLAEAGYPKGFKMEVSGVGDRWYNVANMQYGAAALKRIGIEVKLTPQEVATFYENLRKRNYDSFGTLMGILSGDPDGVFSSFYITGAARGEVGYSDPKFDEMFERQAREIDPAKRREIVWEMQRILLREVIWPMFGNRGEVANRLAVVRGGELACPFGSYFNVRYETIWLAE